MGTIMRRLKLIAKVWMHGLLASAEDPRQIFAGAHERQSQLLERVRQAQSRVVSAKDALEARITAARATLPRFEEQARQALVAGNEDGARYALQRRQMVEAEVHVLEGQLAELEDENRALGITEHRLSTQIEAFFARRRILEARYDSAEAHVRITEELSGVSNEFGDLGRALEEAEQRSDDMQARVSALDELQGIGVIETPGLDALESGDAIGLKTIETQLEALKKEIRVG